MFKIISKYMVETFFLLIFVAILCCYLSQGVSGYIFSILVKEIPRLVMSTFIAIGIFFLFGVRIGKSMMKKKLINNLYADQPVRIEEFLVIPFQEGKIPELTKSDLTDIARESIRGFIVNLGPWPYKYIQKKDKLVIFPDLHNSITLAIVSWSLLIIKDYLVINTSFLPGIVSFVLDIISIGLVFSSGIALGEHIIKRKISCIYTHREKIPTGISGHYLNAYIRGKIPTGIGKYVGIPYPLFGNIDSTFIFHSDILFNVKSELKWKLADYESKLEKVRSYMRETVAKELEKQGLHYEGDIDLWQR